jgi:hypothetical protein
MLNALSVAYASENLGLLVMQLGWYQDGDGLAYQLLSGVTVDPLGGHVPGADDAIQILAQDRVVRRLHN